MKKIKVLKKKKNKKLLKMFILLRLI